MPVGVGHHHDAAAQAARRFDHLKASLVGQLGGAGAVEDQHRLAAARTGTGQHGDRIGSALLAHEAEVIAR